VWNDSLCGTNGRRTCTATSLRSPRELDVGLLFLESGSAAGAAMAEWGHVRVFSPWRYNLAPAARRLQEADGWTAPEVDYLPTGAELVADYLSPLAKLAALSASIRYDAQVVGIARDGIDRVRTAGREDTPFMMRLADGSEVTARAIIDARADVCGTGVEFGVDARGLGASSTAA